jgi:hypothetical protein
MYNVSTSWEVYRLTVTHFWGWVHPKKRFAIFPSLAGMPLAKLSLDGNNLIMGEFGQ